MGNSEVGHLNLGAGAVVKQDLTRIDEAVADGSLARTTVAARRRSTARRARPPDRPGLRRRRALGLEAPRGADRAGGRPLASTDLVDPRLHRRARHVAHTAARSYLAQVEDWCDDAPATRASARSSAATSRWTATARWDRIQQAYDLLVHGKARRTTPTPAAQAAARRLRARRDRRVHHRHDRRRRGAHPPRRQRHRLQLPPRPDARDHARAGRAGFTTSTAAAPSWSSATRR